MPAEFIRLTATELKALPPGKTVFFFPMGALEDHGPHLPLGLDLDEASRLCQLAAGRLEKELSGWRGVLMPAAPISVEADTTALAITVRPHVVRDWLVDSCRSLQRAGFSHFVCFTGYLGPRQLTAIEDAGKVLQKGRLWKKFRGAPPIALVSASSALVSGREVRTSPFWPDALEHGGRRDTSVALAVSTVEPAYAALPSVERPAGTLERLASRLTRKTQGYWGRPSEAQASEGEKILAGTLDQVFPKLRAVWEGSNPNHLFRSWYSILPPNKSFFKGWLLAALLILIMWLWVITNLKILGT